MSLCPPFLYQNLCIPPLFEIENLFPLLSLTLGVGVLLDQSSTDPQLCAVPLSRPRELFGRRFARSLPARCSTGLPFYTVKHVRVPFEIKLFLPISAGPFSLLS